MVICGVDALRTGLATHVAIGPSPRSLISNTNHIYSATLHSAGLEYIVKEKSPTDSPQQDRQKRVEWAMITCKVRGLISPGDLVVVAAGRRNHQGVNESLCHYEIQTVV